MLSGPEILRQIELGNIVIDPLLGKVGPNSYDLRLAKKLKVYEAQMAYLDAWPSFRPTRQLVLSDRIGGHKYTREEMILDTRRPNPTLDLMIPDEGLVLVPGVLYLAATVEHTKTFKHVPRIDGRSSMARLGVCVHLTAGLGDQGVRVTWTLELTVLSPVRVYADERICQIYYEEVQGESLSYDGKYQGNLEAQASLKHLDQD